MISRLRLRLLLALILVFGALALPALEYPQTDYEVLQDQVRELVGKRAYGEAIGLLDGARGKFPEKQSHLASITIQICVLAGESGRALKTLEAALDDGLWFSFDPDRGAWSTLAKQEGFGEILSRNEKNRARAQEASRPVIHVQPPKVYTAERKYPLLIVLHGWGSRNEHTRGAWKSGLLEREWLVAYLQSSQLQSPTGFCWTDRETARKEVLEMFEGIVAEWSVDPERVVVGGFSQGGNLAVDLTVEGLLPAAGFLAMNPSNPWKEEGLSPPDKAPPGLQGVLITGKDDELYPMQKDLKKTLKGMGIPLRFEAVSGVGHALPPDFSERLDRALTRLVD